ncbi:uncharacterized protein LAESUDRAFT_759225 [Laetiporus sulphureus 93-53]|uniref:Uncharacterized protein n=1 Tax=Laetiporus sulphureus 93-53 TaxID=1314785 RepID=A0A165ECL1_9APHY|nr:uncharacterized protein LAESUDRAFT_759225 [Laetiporus sulphureus 93-53]KZT06733.1 hypothetical protein LAESUDRAFT_759225 [Laetiporus sulphureus 93-53]
MLVPYSLVHNGICYTILPLFPGPSPAHTALDPILLDGSAFHDRHAVPPYTYPAITSATCSWTAILSQIWQPDVVWSCWKLATLGSYSSVAAIWEAWAEGERVADVSRKPPLRELEWLWGAQKKHDDEEGLAAKLATTQRCHGSSAVGPFHVLHLVHREAAERWQDIGRGRA